MGHLSIKRCVSTSCRAEPFVSTGDVIFGYTDWLNRATGLFFVAAQDMIEAKYSHGYKRNLEHLLADRVMLPADPDGGSGLRVHGAVRPDDDREKVRPVPRVPRREGQNAGRRR